jgi:hypothetical protein
VIKLQAITGRTRIQHKRQYFPGKYGEHPLQVYVPSEHTFNPTDFQVFEKPKQTFSPIRGAHLQLKSCLAAQKLFVVYRAGVL